MSMLKQIHLLIHFQELMESQHGLKIQQNIFYHSVFPYLSLGSFCYFLSTLLLKRWKALALDVQIITCSQ